MVLRERCPPCIQHLSAMLTQSLGNFDQEILDKEVTSMGGGFDPRSAFNSNKDDKLRDDITKAAKEIIKNQSDLGLDVITDGEVERGA